MAKIHKKSDVSNGVDRISFLPKPLLDHVLSYIPTLEVVQTCVLSKQWRNIWCSVPTLSFDSNMVDFVEFVDSVLIQRDGSNIQRLDISLDEEEDCSRINAWIIYALRHNVEAINIKLSNNVVALTPLIFISESLTEFKLTYNTLDLPDLVCLPSLRKLHFVAINVSGQIDEAFFSAIPLLKALLFENCDLSKQESITISGFQLETLKIDFKAPPKSIIIFSQRLKSLELKLPEKCEVSLWFDGNFSYLFDAKLDIALKSSEAISYLFGIVKHVENLTLSSQFLSNSFDTTPRELYKEEQLQSKHKFPKLKLVEIEGFQGSDSEVKMVQFLLENAICLKRLTVTIAKIDGHSLVKNKEMMKIQTRLSRHPRASLSAGIDFLQNLY